MQAETCRASAPCSSSFFGDLLRILDPQTSFHILVGAEAAGDGKIRPDSFPDGLQHLQGHPEAPLQASSILVFPLVGKRGEKLIQQVPMGHVDFHAVGPRFLRPSGACGVGPNEFGNFFLGKRFGHFLPDRAGDGGGGDTWGSRCKRKAFGARRD